MKIITIRQLCRGVRVFPIIGGDADAGDIVVQLSLTTAQEEALLRTLLNCQAAPTEAPHG